MLSLISATSAAARPAARRHGEVLVTASVSGATVLIDGRNVGVTPVGKAIYLHPGAHTVQVEKVGYSYFSQRVIVMSDITVPVYADLTAQTSGPIDLALEPLPALTGQPLVPTSLSFPPPQDEPRGFTASAPPMNVDMTVESEWKWYRQWWIWTAASVVLAGGGFLAWDLTRSHNPPSWKLGDTTIRNGAFQQNF